MSEPDITILCSSYNSSPYLDKYCHSLNSQLLKNFNLVFVDAASTDNSLDKFKSFNFRQGINVEIIECQERISVYEAWNLAIKSATTGYCMNYNTDDHLYPAALSTMLDYASTFPDVDIFYSRCFVASNAEHTAIVTVLDKPEYSHSALLERCLGGPFPLLKREAVIEAGLFDPDCRIAGDYELWLRMSKMGYKFQKIPESIGCYFLNPVGLSTNQSYNDERNSQVEEIRKKYS